MPRPKLDKSKLPKGSIELVHGDPDKVGIVAVPVKYIPTPPSDGSVRSGEKGCHICGTEVWLDPRSQQVLKDLPENAVIYCGDCFFGTHQWKTKNGAPVVGRA